MTGPRKAPLAAAYGAREELVTLEQAYLAAFAFLERHYTEFGFRDGGDLGTILGGMSILPDGQTADPAAWHVWISCVRKAQDGQIDATLSIAPPEIREDPP